MQFIPTLWKVSPLSYQVEVPNLITETPKSDMESDSDYNLSQGKFLFIWWSVKLESKLSSFKIQCSYRHNITVHSNKQTQTIKGSKASSTLSNFRIQHRKFQGLATALWAHVLILRVTFLFRKLSRYLHLIKLFKVCILPLEFWKFNCFLMFHLVSIPFISNWQSLCWNNILNRLVFVLLNEMVLPHIFPGLCCFYSWFLLMWVRGSIDLVCLICSALVRSWKFSRPCSLTSKILILMSFAKWTGWKFTKSSCDAFLL